MKIKKKNEIKMYIFSVLAEENILKKKISSIHKIKKIHKKIQKIIFAGNIEKHNL